MSPITSIATLLELSPELPELARWLVADGPPDAWLAAGCVVQSVWNGLTGKRPGFGILDYDVVYFDPDLSAETEAIWGRRLSTAFPGLKLDVKNQARVHLWYPEKFGLQIPAFASVAAAMCGWPTTATATAARLSDQQHGRWVILAPFGTDDLTSLVLRPNRTLVNQAIYRAKASRWAGLWPELRVLPWEEAIGPFELNGPVDLDPARVRH